MEDVLVLNEMLHQFPGDRKKAFEEYSKHRNPDAEAMADLAMYNYIEVISGSKKIRIYMVQSYIVFQMRDLTARTSFLLRKKLDNLLFWIFPQKWVPLYTSVTFSRMRYHHCVANKKWQDEVRKITLPSFFDNISNISILVLGQNRNFDWSSYVGFGTRCRVTLDGMSNEIFFHVAKQSSTPQLDTIKSKSELQKKLFLLRLLYPKKTETNTADAAP